MLQRTRLITFVLSSILLVARAQAADPDRDFSGKWLLNAEHSDSRALPADPYPVLQIDQKTAITCTATTPSGSTVKWTYRFDGTDSKYAIAGETMNSAAKWEGSALLINTLVSGSRDYTVMDRWTLSRDGNQLNIQRQVMSGAQQLDGYLIYRREGAFTGPPASTGTAMVEPSGAGQTTLARRPETPAKPVPTEFTVPAGTHILLSLTNTISTKNSKDGDHVYLETAVPVAADGRIVIPRGSYVQASISKVKAAGRGSAKSELFLHFDTLTLPNGVSRDFRARLSSADTTKGKVDQDEGKVTGNGKDTSGGKVAKNTGIGSVGGVLIGGAAGHPLAGLGAGAAAGLATVFGAKNEDVTLPKGTSVEMVLDRDLYFTSEEIRR